jgi:hypothetical protein
MSHGFSSDLASSPVRPAANGLGIAGFVVSLLGILTCGLIAPVGLLLSLLALLKRPRGFATAGSVIGLLGTIWLAAVGAVIMTGVTRLKPAAEQFVEEFGPAAATLAAVTEAAQEVSGYRREHGDWPDDVVGQEMVGEHQDAYGTTLKYTRVGDLVLVISAGKDGEFATLDDLSLDPNQLPERGSESDWPD